MDSEVIEYLDHLVSIGALERRGEDFAITDKTEALAPEIYREHMHEVYGDLMLLVDKGLMIPAYNDVTGDFDFQLTPLGKLTVEVNGGFIK
jgi:hypothetical protein